ncbi:MAG: PhnD/SsuA/transferrin family substrate-binding protein [Anaerolineae bacterium]
MRSGCLRFLTFLAPNMFPVYEFITEYIGQHLRYPTTLQVGASFDQFETGQADVGFLCGLPYVQLSGQHPAPVQLLAAPVLQGARYHGQPVYFSDVIVHRDSPFHTFAELRGCVWAYNDPDSHSGYNVVRYRLAQMGETLDFFGQVVEAGWHQQAIRLVADHTVDGAAIDSQVLAIELRDDPTLAAQLRVIESLGPSSIQPVVAARQLPEEIKAAVRTILLAMGDDPVAQTSLAHGFVERFAPVTDATYDDIRMMLAAATRVSERSM